MLTAEAKRNLEEEIYTANQCIRDLDDDKDKLFKEYMKGYLKGIKITLEAIGYKYMEFPSGLVLIEKI